VNQIQQHEHIHGYLKPEQEKIQPPKAVNPNMCMAAQINIIKKEPVDVAVKSQFVQMKIANYTGTYSEHIKVKVKSKAIPVTGLGGLWGCEMLRIPHCLDNRLTDGSKVVSPTHRPYFTPQKHYYFNVSGTHFC
jgi:hypothetical protein